jgi:hypothetical protein
LGTIEGSVRTMILRHASRCAGCAAELAPGTRAHYLADRRLVRCHACGPEPVRRSAFGTARAASDRAAAAAALLADRRAAVERRSAAFAEGDEDERIVAE